MRYPELLQLYSKITRAIQAFISQKHYKLIQDLALLKKKNKPSGTCFAALYRPMKPFTALIALFALLMVISCQQYTGKANIPDIRIIYGNIGYIDSMLTSPVTDSISAVNNALEDTLSIYRNRMHTPDDQSIYDSLMRIHTLVNDFLNHCTSSGANIELLFQDVKDVEMQYKSGKISIDYYISALIQSEQVQVDVYNSFLSERNKALMALRNQALIVPKFNHLATKEQQN